MSKEGKQKKVFYKRWWFWAIIIVLAIGFFGVDGDDETAEKASGETESSNDNESSNNNENNNDESSNSNEEENANEAEENDEEQELTVGDTANFNDMDITLNEVRIEEGGEFDEPGEDQFVVANLTIENETDEEQSISSILNIELKDSEGYAYNTTIMMEGTKGQLDGSIEPGGKMKGEIPFDVTESDEYELHFSNPFSEGKAIWTIANDDL